MKKRMAALLIGVVLGVPAHAAEKARTATMFKSGPEQVHLIELYTSESRKAGPPADRWLSTLKDSPRLWKEFVPVAFHVDYGEKPGWWKDRFADKRFTDRLISYAALWRLGRPFVPTVYLNGTEWSGWAREEDVPAALRKKTGMLFARKGSADEVEVRFQPEERTNPYWTAHAALLGIGVPSKIDGGENVGQLLEHDLIALTYGSSPMISKRGEYHARVKLPLKTTRPNNGLALVVWVSREDNILPVQAAGGILQRPLRPKTR